MTRRDLGAAILAALAAVAGLYALTRIQWAAMPDVTGSGALVGWLLIPAAFVAGQAHRGYKHGRGIIANHFRSIIGGTAAIVGVALAALVMVGAS